MKRHIICPIPMYEIVIDAVRAIIYSFSAVFALVVVQMVCARAYLQERTDIGIYKAVGFTTSALRLQFAFRFLIVAVIGSVIGIVLSSLTASRLLSGLLRGMGITNMHVELTAAAAAVPAALICVCFFVFAYQASGRIRRVSVRELVTE